MLPATVSSRQAAIRRSLASPGPCRALRRCRRVADPLWNEIVERHPSAPGTDAHRQAASVRVVEDPMPDSHVGLDPGETAAIPERRIAPGRSPSHRRACRPHGGHTNVASVRGTRGERAACSCKLGNRECCAPLSRTRLSRRRGFPHRTRADSRGARTCGRRPGTSQCHVDESLLTDFDYTWPFTK